jgi:hypothetical protein
MSGPESGRRGERRVGPWEWDREVASVPRTRGNVRLHPHGADHPVAEHGVPSNPLAKSARGWHLCAAMETLPELFVQLAIAVVLAVGLFGMSR